CPARAARACRRPGPRQPAEPGQLRCLAPARSLSVAHRGGVRVDPGHGRARPAALGYPRRGRRGGRVVVGASEHEVPAGWAAAELEAALAVPVEPGVAAFFDVDNTMMQGASIYWLARGLAARKYFTTADLVRFAWGQLKFRVLARERH